MLGIDKEQIKSLVESVDRFSKNLERIANALEKIEASHKEYVEFSRESVEVSMELSRRALGVEEAAPEEPATEKKGGKK